MRELTEKQLDLISGGNGGEQSSNGPSIVDNSGYSLLTVGGAATRPSVPFNPHKPTITLIPAIIDSQTTPNQGGHTDSTADMDMTGDSQDTDSDSTTGDGSGDEDTEEAALVSVSVDDMDNISIVVEEGATISDLNALVDERTDLTPEAKEDLIEVVNKIELLSDTDSIASQFGLNDSEGGGYAGNTLDNPITNAANVIEQVLNSDDPNLVVDSLSGTFDAAFNFYIPGLPPANSNAVFSPDYHQDLYFNEGSERAESLIHLSEAVAQNVSVLDGYNAYLPFNSVLNIVLNSGYDSEQLLLDSSYHRNAEFDRVIALVGLGHAESQSFEAAISDIRSIANSDSNSLTSIEANQAAIFIVGAIYDDFVTNGATVELALKFMDFLNEFNRTNDQGVEALGSYVSSILENYLEDPNNPDYAGFLDSTWTAEGGTFDFTPINRGLSSDFNLSDDGIA